MKSIWKTKIGIDYSLTSPAIHIDDIRSGTFSFHYLTSKKKWIGRQGENITGYEHKEWNDPIERFTYISDFVMDLLSNYKQNQPIIFIEGYSFGSKGQAVFQIAENCGILKYRLMDKRIDYETVVPTQVKKFASGKGNADKQLMYDSFCKEHKNELMKDFDMGKLNNPVTDIVDSFYIAKYGFDKNKKSN